MGRQATFFAHRQRFLALALLTATLGVAVGERSALSIAGPGLAESLDLDPAALGWLLSAFAWSYVIAHLPAGLVVDRLGTRRTIGLGLGCCALISLLTALAGLPALTGHAFALILLLRIALGIFQAPVGPASGMAIAAWFPGAERGMAGAIFSSAANLALAVINPLLGWIAGYYQWQTMFLAMALIGLTMTVLWWLNFHMPRHHPKLSERERDLLERGGALLDIGGPRAVKAGGGGHFRELLPLLTHRMMAGVFIAQYCVTAIAWFFIAWFPGYLVLERGFTLAQAGAVSALPAVSGVIGGVLCGLFSDWLLRLGATLTMARKLPLYLGIGLSTLAMVSCLVVESDTAIVALMTLALFGKGFGTLGWTLVADLAPREQVGSTGGLFNAIGNASGIVTPLVIGYLVAAFGNFDAALVFMAAHGVVAIGCHALMVGKLERLTLDRPEAG